MDSAISNSIKTVLNLGFKIVSFWFKLWLLPINSIFEWIQERVKPIVVPLFTFLHTHKTKLLKYSLLSIFYLGFLLFVTLISYYALYSTLVPKVSTEEPLFFDYSYKSTKKIVADVQASVEFQKNKHYSIFLELELPESPKNQDVGMFMACMEIDDHDKWNPQKIHHTCRPAILKYSSGILKYIKSFLMSIPYLFGFYEEKQTVVLSMGDNFIANRYYQTISAQIQINNPEIQIYKASLKFLANLKGFDYYLYYYPITSFIVGCSIIYISLLSSSIFFVASLYLYRHFNQKEQEGIKPIEDSSDEEIELHNSLVGEDLNDFSSSSSSAAIPSSSADAVSSSNIQRRNAANYKRKPIWEIEDDNPMFNKDNNNKDNNIGNNISSTKPNNEDSLGIFASPKMSKDSKSVEDSKFYRELDEAFNNKLNNQKNFNNTINNNNYSWDQELKDIDSLLDEKQKQQEQKYKQKNKDKPSTTPSSPSLKNKQQQQQKKNQEFDSKNNNEDIQAHSLLILSTSENTTPIQHSSNKEEEKAPNISIEQTITNNISNNNNDDDNDKKNIENETTNNITINDDSPVNISSPSDSDKECEEHKDEETKESAEQDEEGEESEKPPGNSGFSGNDEWVKVLDSSIRKRKN
ncbi:hypothetical protein DICPUDRAFT_98758 [Dictyostelium purpureum]|uniref:Seipin n=1 Tax=Dictyostelium purpureum TaxID=5786 RepID=F0ZTA2_DICPU|nr:uncharacterized protein DICPUDRAFT_98758 [Dictyostelium purpureum]EGC32829.1 hypothetical protein DICPUDRAFT_98758 [Dictyostelium purpureum]|eukprot:XP_003290652.1 hypothetical protein DICPUDRAFT_98758 [Dictyostelium purpureum]